MLLAALALWAGGICRGAEGLTAARLGVVYDLDDRASTEIAQVYVQLRAIPRANLIGVHVPHRPLLTPAEFAPLREQVLDRLPSSVQSLLLVWSRPHAVGCMSVTTAFAAGYRAGFCEPGCGATLPSPLYDSEGWLPADTIAWWPAMLLPSDDTALARAVIHRGMQAGAPGPPAVAYLVNTQDKARNVRAARYPELLAAAPVGLVVRQLVTPVQTQVPDAIAYFTGAAQVAEIARLHFRPGAVADHLTSTGGILYGGSQMPALAWLRQGATASYGTVSEPCNRPAKFPDPGVLLRHYARGETLLEAYWKSVAMPGQGLFIGEPLARPFAVHPR